MYSPTSPLSKAPSNGSFSPGGPSTPGARKTRPRPRLLNLTKLFPITRSYAPSTDSPTPFRPIHTPDRPEQLTPASAAPSEEQCREFFVAFRSPKKFGFFDEEDARSPEEERFGGIDKSLWKPWPLSDSPPPLRTEDVVTSPRRLASPLTAVSFRSQSPLLEEARVVRGNSASVAKLIDVDCGSRLDRKDLRAPHETVEEEEETVEKNAERPRKDSYVRTLQEAQQRSGILAAHRLASRVSGNMRDSGYKSWRGSEQQQQQQGSTVQESPSQLPSDVRHQDEALASPRSEPSHRSWESGSRAGAAGHIAHHLSAIGEDAEQSSKGSAFDHAGDSRPNITLDVALDECVRRESVCSRFRKWQTPEQQRQFEEDIEMYGDWAEYYFTTEYFETDKSRQQTSSRDDVTARSIRTASSDTQARGEGSLHDSEGVSPKTVRYENDQGAGYFPGGSTHERDVPDKRPLPAGDKTTSSPQKAASKKRHREAFAYTPRRELMKPPGLRFQHETDQEALFQQEVVLGTPWVRPLVTRPRRSESYYQVAGDVIMNRPPPSPGTFGGMI